jgi:SSS family solute:Na+ symporter
LINGLVKVPMQFFILLIGVLVFSFYQFRQQPLSYNETLVSALEQTNYKDSVQKLQQDFARFNQYRSQAIGRYTREKNYSGTAAADNIRNLNQRSDSFRTEFRNLYLRATGKTAEEANDTNYVFLSFVKNYLPAGLKGLLIAMIFLAAWGSIAAALNSLAATTVIDFHKRMDGGLDPAREYSISRWYTLGWGLFSILVAQFASRLGQSLIEAVNVLGSLFYGVILGIFLVAFYLKRIGGTATFYAAIVVELLVILLFFNERIPGLSFLPDVSFLWLNAIGALGVMVGAAVLQMITGNKVRGTKYEVRSGSLK